MSDILESKKDAHEMLTYLIENMRFEPNQLIVGLNLQKYFLLKKFWKNERYLRCVNICVENGWFDEKKIDSSQGISIPSFAAFISAKENKPVALYLSEEGYRYYINERLIFNLNTEEITVITNDGEHDLLALVEPNYMKIFTDSVDIVERNEILRKKTRGKLEKLIIDKSHYKKPTNGYPAHYEINYHKDGVIPMEDKYNVVNNYHLNGANSRVNNKSIDRSINTYNDNEYDISKLSKDIEKIIPSLLGAPNDAQNLIVAGKLSEIKIAADSGDKMLVESKIKELNPAYKSVIAIAQSTTAGVLAKLLCDYLNIK